MPEPLLQFDHVTKEFDLNKNWFGKPSNRFRAVNEVTWQVEQGAALGIVGESGCGKSTMARMAVGLELPTYGEVRFAGKTLGKWLKEEAILLTTICTDGFSGPFSVLESETTHPRNSGTATSTVDRLQGRAANAANGRSFGSGATSFGNA